MFIVSQSMVKKFSALGTLHVTEDNKIYTSNGSCALIASPCPNIKPGEYEIEQPSFFRLPSSLDFYRQLESHVKVSGRDAYLPLPAFKNLYKYVKYLSSCNSLKSTRVNFYCKSGVDNNFFIGVDIEGFMDGEESIPTSGAHFMVHGITCNTFNTEVNLNSLVMAMEPIGTLKIKNTAGHYVKIQFCGEEEPLSFSWQQGPFYLNTIMQYVSEGKKPTWYAQDDFDEDLPALPPAKAQEVLSALDFSETIKQMKKDGVEIKVVK